MENIKKPPIGLKPRYIWECERKLEIFEAMRRYSEAQMPIPIEWIEELKNLLGIECQQVKVFIRR